MSAASAINAMGARGIEMTPGMVGASAGGGSSMTVGSQMAMGSHDGAGEQHVDLRAHGIPRRFSEKHWLRCAKLPIQLTVLIPLPSLSLTEMMELAKGQPLMSTWASREDVPLLAGDVFLANVTFEPAGAYLGVRISGFQRRDRSTQMAGDPAGATPLAPSAVSGEGTDLRDTLSDLRIPVSLCFGAKTMPLHQILELTSGDAIVLDRALKAEVTVLAGQRIVAYGELIAVKGVYGVRLTRLAELSKRLEDSQAPLG